MKVDVLDMFQSMASTGQAPPEGCSLFGVGYEDAFERLKSTYLIDAFGRGRAAQKFVVGPFGSGKTHFLRQLMEIARGLDCVTAEVALTKSVDFTKSLIRFQELAGRVQAPDSARCGMRPLLEACLRRVRSAMPPGSEAGELVARGWAEGLDGGDFDLTEFGRVVSIAALAILDRNEERAGTACQWLEGAVNDSAIARALAVPRVAAARQDSVGQRMLLSLFQLVRNAGYGGTLVGFDEAEQGLTLDRRGSERVMQILQADSNAFELLSGGSALVVYAVTPDVVTQMMNFAALQQRIADPGPGFGFFDGFTFAPVIDLTRHRDVHTDLPAIGRRLAEVFFQHVPPEPLSAPENVIRAIDQMAADVAENNPTGSSRREMVKRTCAWLLMSQASGVAAAPDGPSYASPATEPPSEAEV